jgi:hypothetical protein
MGFKILKKYNSIIKKDRNANANANVKANEYGCVK